MKHYIKDGEEVIELTKEEAERFRDTSTKAEKAARALRMIISYHERVTHGVYPELDFFPHALQYALDLVVKEIEREKAEKKSAAEG